MSVEELPRLLRPAIEKYRDEADLEGRLPDELVEALRAAGAFRLYTPRERGGFETSLRQNLDVLDQLGRLDGPTAWVVWNLNMGFLDSVLPKSGSDRLWANNPDPLVANGTQPGQARPAEDGGFQLSGTWKIVSGTDIAKWFILGALIFDDGQLRMTDAGPDYRFFLVPRSSVQVQPTWNVNGMRATSSNAVVVDDVFVPADMVMEEEGRIDRPTYRLPTVSLVFPGCAAILIGMAQAAVDEVTRLVQAKRAPDGSPLSDQARVQAALARAQAQVTAARLGLMDAVTTMDRTVEAGEEVTVEQRGVLRGAICHVTETSRTVLTAMYEAGSSDPLYASSRLGRLLRDGFAAAQHNNLSTAHYELAGRILLGLPPNTGLL